MMTEFHKLQMVDVVEPIRAQLENPNSGFSVTREHKIRIAQRMVPGPWIMHGAATERQCLIWTIWHNNYRFIPSKCRGCWKITYSPMDLKEVYKVEEVMEELGMESKVGMETRNWTGNVGGYSAFWYGELGCGLRRARGLHTRVKRELTKKIGYSPNLILKRGCTEFERIMGSSDGWDKLAMENGWDEQEKILMTVFESPPPPSTQPAMLAINTRLRMIYYAHEHGDQTYRDFVGEENLPPLTRYEKSIHSEKDFPMEEDNELNLNRSDDAKSGAADNSKLTIV